MLSLYLYTGVLIYTGAAIARRHTFRNATVPSIVRGAIIGILAWPIGLVLLYISRTR